MARQVILISSDAELANDLATALSDQDRLTVVDAPEDLGTPTVPAIAAVVVDLPADARRGAYEQLRASYAGEIVLLVDPGEDGDDGLPDDPARRILVRPVAAADLVASLPSLAAPPAPEPGAELARVESPGRLVHAEIAAALWPPAPSSPARARRPLGAEVAAGLVLLLLGGLIGLGLGTQQRGPARAATATSVVVATTVVVRQAVPAACTAALANADEAINYFLMGRIRDQRLLSSLEQFQDHSRACRKAAGAGSPGPAG
jgi:hypothetical protein